VRGVSPVQQICGLTADRNLPNSRTTGRHVKRHVYRSSSSIEYRSHNNRSYCVADGNLQPGLITISRHQSTPLTSHRRVDCLSGPNCVQWAVCHDR